MDIQGTTNSGCTITDSDSQQGKRRCNKCDKIKKEKAFKHIKKKTCRKCETNRWRQFLRLLVRDKKLKPIEKLAVRAGYFGTGILMFAMTTLNPIAYTIGLSCIVFQTLVRKQWNLVALNGYALLIWGLRALGFI